MNERIQLLAKQAGVYFGEATVDYLGDKYPAFISTREMDVEKFVELLVRECISTLDIDDGATHHSELLLEHFGVEK